MKKIWLSFVLFIMTTALIIANLTKLNGMTTIEIAHKLPVLLMPADYTLIIRPIILLFLAYWIYKFRPYEPSSTKQVTLFTISCLATSAWFPLWHFGIFGWAFFTNIVVLLSLYMLYRMYPAKENGWGQRVPIALFFSWTLIDFVMNLNYLLVFDEWSRMGLSNVLWTILNLTILTAIALHFSYHHRDGVITAVFVWVFFGIIVNIQLEELFVSLSGLFLLSIMVWGLWMFSPSTHSRKTDKTSF